MTSALSPTSPFVSASLHDDSTLSRIALERPKANILTIAMMQVVERLYVDRTLTSRDGSEGICAVRERRKPVWEAR